MASGISNVYGMVVVPEQKPVVVTVSVPWPLPVPDSLVAAMENVKDPDPASTEPYVSTVLLLASLSPAGPNDKLKLNSPL